MGKIDCCVPGCIPEAKSSRHRFIHPQKDTELFSQWLCVIGNKRLCTLDRNYVYDNFRVCERHFDDEQFGPNKKLKRTACPKLLLPVVQQVHVQASPKMEVEHSYSKKYNSENVNSISTYLGPGTVLGTETETVVACPETPIFQTGTVLSTETETVVARPETPIFQTGKRGLLNKIHVAKVAELSPKQHFLYKQVLNCKKRIMKLRQKNLDFKTRLQQATNISEHLAFEKVTMNMNTITKNFFQNQLFCASKKPKGRRFTTQDKIMSLALYKQSGVGYQLLRRMFTLPSRVTLMKLLNSIPITAGINKSIFNALKETAASLSQLDKNCILIFDEMSLTPNLTYNHHTDHVEGFEDFGDRQTDQIANHVQVFMLRGINRKWKQPILYQFVKGAVKAAQLMKTIRDVIHATGDAGLNVIATMCDQGTNNVSAINQLVEQTKANYLRRGEELKQFIFEVNGNTIIPLYDPPHLLKGLRNNLLVKNIYFEINGQKKLAKWEEIYTAWLLDNFSGELRAMPKLTEFHVNKSNMKKMKVSAAAQVFSHTVSSTINLMARTSYSTPDGRKMETRATETAEFCKFVDNLFDSVNGYGRFNRHGKILRTSVDVNKNVHSNFWQGSIQVLATMKCIGSDGKLSTPPTFKNWISTLKNLQLLTTTLKERKFKFFNPRYLNQDPLENFFGKIRQRGQRAVNPTTSAFGQYYKSLLVSNLISRQSVGGNCKEDNCSILLSLQKFIGQDTSDVKSNKNKSCFENGVPIPETFPCLKPLEEYAIAYVAGFIAKIKLKIGKCTTCQHNILLRSGENLTQLHQFIANKEYGCKNMYRLKYCNVHFIMNLIKMYNIIFYVLKLECYKPDVYLRIYFTIRRNIDFKFVACEHSNNLCEKIIKHFSRLLLFNYFKGVNNILYGKDARDLPKNCSQLLRQAKEMCNKYKIK